MKRDQFSPMAWVLGVIAVTMLWCGSVFGQDAAQSLERNFLTESRSSGVIEIVNRHKLKRISSTGSWQSLASPESGTVSECSLAGDNNNLYVFYDGWHPELNFNLGQVKQLVGTDWDPLGGGVTDCNGPQIVINDSIIVEGWLSKNYEYNFSTNETGNWWGVMSSSLYHQYGVQVAIAEKKKGYICYSSGVDLGVCVDCPPAGYGCIMSGHRVGLSNSVGAYPKFAADDSGWVTLFAESGWLYAYGAGPGCVNRPYNDRRFRDVYSAGAVQPEQLVLRAGIPTAIWTDADTIYVAEWHDSLWTLALTGPSLGSYFGISATTVDSILYMSFGDTGYNPRLSVFKYDGTNVTYFDGQIEDDSSSTLTSVSLSTYKGNPVIAFVEDGTLKVKAYNLGTGVVRQAGGPSFYTLRQNYPNPFNPTTVISYQLPAAGKVSIKLYDVLGRQVATLIDGIESAGTHTVILDGSHIPSGVYFYILRAGNFSETKKLVVLK